MTAQRLRVVPPQDDRPGLMASAEAEQALLGSILIDHRALFRIDRRLAPEHFCLPPHQVIFRAMLDMADRSVPPDLILLGAELSGRGQLGAAGDMGYLASLAQHVPTAVNAEHYGDLVLQLGRKRQVEEIRHQIAVEEGPTAIRALMDELHDALQDQSDESGLQTLEAAFREQNERLDRTRRGEQVGLRSGFRRLDATMGPWKPKDLIVVAGDTGSGKTSWAINVTYHLIYQQGKHVAYFSLEMAKDEIADRLISLATGISAETIRDMALSDGEALQMAEAQGRLSGKRLRLDESGIVSLRDLRRQVEPLLRYDPVDLIVVDHLGLMQPPKADNRTQEVTKIAEGLKQLAMNLSVPILALHQLNRNSVGRSNPEPVLTDLRDSSAVAQSASIVLAVYRDDNPESSHAHQAKVSILKNRQGPCGHTWMHWNPLVMRFSELETRYDN